MSCFPTTKASDLTDVRGARSCSVPSASALSTSAFYRVDAELRKGIVFPSREFIFCCGGGYNSSQLPVGFSTEQLACLNLPASVLLCPLAGRVPNNLENPAFFFLWYGRSRSKARSLHEKKLLVRKLLHGRRWSHAAWQIMITKTQTKNTRQGNLENPAGS